MRTALLAVAALAALGLAAVRITRAAEHKTIVVVNESAGPQRSATSAQAAATPAKLHAPPGFRAVSSCRFPFDAVAEKCFWTPHALALDGREAQRISDSWPARAGYVPFLDPCFGPHRLNGGIVMSHCNWELELGPELVAVSADSVLVPANAIRSPRGAKVLRYWRRGTEIELGVVGHWPHDKVPASARRL